MGKFSGYVICSDIDGTLITTENKIHPKNLEAIRYFREQGGKFTLATGRMFKSVERFIPVISPDLPPIVLNGCGIYDFEKKEYLWLLPLDDEAEVPAKDIIKHFPKSAPVIVSKNDSYFLNDNPSGEYLRKVEGFSYLQGSFETVEKPWIKFLYCQTPEETEQIRQMYDKSPYREQYKMVRSGATYYELFNKNANKGAALKRLSEIFGFSLDKTIAIGDNENDLEMILTAKFGAAVENANPILKKQAHIITKCNNDGAIADLIEKIEKLI